MYAHHIALPSPTMMSVYADNASFAARKRMVNNRMNWIAGLFRRSTGSPSIPTIPAIPTPHHRQGRPRRWPHPQYRRRLYRPWRPASGERTGHAGSPHHGIEERSAQDARRRLGWEAERIRRSRLCTEVAEGVGFEPTDPCGSPVFKTGALNRSAIPPTNSAQATYRKSSKPACAWLLTVY
jgi:hypothetical protein